VVGDRLTPRSFASNRRPHRRAYHGAPAAEGFPSRYALRLSSLSPVLVAALIECVADTRSLQKKFSTIDGRGPMPLNRQRDSHVIPPKCPRHFITLPFYIRLVTDGCKKRGSAANTSGQGAISRLMSFRNVTASLFWRCSSVPGIQINLLQLQDIRRFGAMFLAP
jgi:hypothetical protein